jgi:hypothetical protein
MIAQEVAEYLEENDIATLGTDLFIDTVPDVDDDIVVVYNTGGETPDIYVPIENPTFEVLVRSMSADSAYSKAKSIKELLHLKYNVELVDDNTYFYYIQMTGSINLLGRDEKGRIEYSLNFRTKIRA